MRDELVKAIQERTGFDPGMIDQVLSLALEFLKTRVPPEISPMLVMMLGSPAQSAGGTSEANAAGGLSMQDLGELLSGLMKPRES